MNILFIGDIFGRPGRNAVKKLLKQYREELDIELVIANAENMSHGKGVKQEHLNEMREAGIDFFTSGNHVYKEKDIIPFMDNPKLPLLRPANYPETAPGRGFQVIETAMKRRVLVINLMGRVFMPYHMDCPFRAADKILKEHEHEKLSGIFVDFHAETTAEKAALGHYLDGRVSAMIGTHTHVPTADARILPDGTAFQSDVGFTGPQESIIGLEKSAIIDQFISQVPAKHEVADGPIIFNCVKISIDEKSGKATSIQPFQRLLES
ncbi:MAG TPA: TIGR00282 family metallophosphoesterase [Candidatus Gracilibacteria bacterium]|nr:TIGR00282 family metallophosphoesterase [Candidatus Gracilibacteria bacterium]